MKVHTFLSVVSLAGALVFGAMHFAHGGPLGNTEALFIGAFIASAWWFYSPTRATATLARLNPWSKKQPEDVCDHEGKK